MSAALSLQRNSPRAMGRHLHLHLHPLHRGYGFALRDGVAVGDLPRLQAAGNRRGYRCGVHFKGCCRRGRRAASRHGLQAAQQFGRQADRLPVVYGGRKAGLVVDAVEAVVGGAG